MAEYPLTTHQEHHNALSVGLENLTGYQIAWSVLNVESGGRKYQDGAIVVRLADAVRSTGRIVSHRIGGYVVEHQDLDIEIEVLIRRAGKLKAQRNSDGSFKAGDRSHEKSLYEPVAAITNWLLGANGYGATLVHGGHIIKAPGFGYPTAIGSDVSEGVKFLGQFRLVNVFIKHEVA